MTRHTRNLPPRMEEALEDWLSGRPRLTPAPAARSAKNARPNLGGLLAAAADAGLEPVLCAETAAAYTGVLRRAGADERVVARRMGSLRQYARYTGEGLDWAHSTGQRRCGLRREDLPEPMRAGLTRIEREDTPEGLALRRLRYSIESTLRRLIAAARAAGLPETLSAESLAAYETSRRAEGIDEGAIVTAKSQLRRFARFAGLDGAWAEETLSKDNRDIETVLADWRWNRLRPIAQKLLEVGHTSRDLKIVDRWLRFRDGLGRPATEADVEAFSDRSGVAAQRLSTTLALLDPASPDLLAIDAARARLRSRLRSGKRRMTSRRASKPSDLPEPLKSELARVEAAERNRAGGLSEASLVNMRAGVRQFAGFALANDHAPALSDATLAAYALHVNTSHMKQISRAGRFMNLWMFARRAECDPEITRKLLQTASFFKLRANEEVKEKHRKLAARPLELAEVACAARDILEEAPFHDRSSDRRSAFLKSAALAFLSMTPLRIKDLLGMVLGREISRDAEGWSLQLTTSKTRERLAARLDPALTPYLDAAVLLGAEPGALWRLYAAREGGPLFARIDGAAYSKTWLRDAFVQATGHSPHIVRTLMHDRAARGGVGREVAMVLCGQRSTRTAVEYEFSASRERRHAALRQLQELDARLMREASQGSAARRSASSRMSFFRE
ncbi:MAG: hypothetical protein ACQEUZ_06440 [Pseudomonadota bacterium]